MTKPREPRSPQAALLHIADLIGLPEMAKISGRAPRTVLDWSDEDTSAGVSYEHAVAFDQAFLRAGGDHAPMHQAFGYQVRSAVAEQFADEFEIQAVAIQSIKEAGEAHAAALSAARPSSNLSDLDVAIREVAEGSSKFERLAKLLARLRTARRNGETPLPPPEPPP